MDDEIKIGDLVAYKHPNSVTIGMVINKAVSASGPRPALWDITWFNWCGEGGTRQYQDREEDVKLFKKNIKGL